MVEMTDFLGNSIQFCDVCPECKQRPDIYHMGPDWWTAICSDSWCSSRPAALGSTKKEVIKNWNTKMEALRYESEKRISSEEQKPNQPGLSHGLSEAEKIVVGQEASEAASGNNSGRRSDGWRTSRLVRND